MGMSNWYCTDILHCLWYRNQPFHSRALYIKMPLRSTVSLQCRHGVILLDRYFILYILHFSLINRGHDYIILLLHIYATYFVFIVMPLIQSITPTESCIKSILQAPVEAETEANKELRFRASFHHYLSNKRHLSGLRRVPV